MVITFSGAYHGGFSPTYNICEAVNMAAPDSVLPAYKHLAMNEAEGFPRKSCFSLDWMIFESFSRVERLKFSQEGLQKLAEHYKNMVKEELKRRKTSREFVAEEVLFEGKGMRFFELQCCRCRNYCYLSAIGCRQCEKLSCLSCGSQCACSGDKKTMFVRHTERELINY